MTITTIYGTAEVIGPGQLIDKRPDGTTTITPGLYVRYRAADLTELGRAEIWRGGPCVYLVEIDQ